MTLGRFIFLTSDEDRSGGNELLAHELVHTRQFSKGGRDQVSPEISP